MKLVDLLFKIAGLSVKLIFLKNQNKKIIILNSFCCFWHEPVHSQMKQKTKQNKQTHFQSKMKALAKLSKEVFFPYWHLGIIFTQFCHINNKPSSLWDIKLAIDLNIPLSLLWSTYSLWKYWSKQRQPTKDDQKQNSKTRPKYKITHGQKCHKCSATSRKTLNLIRTKGVLLQPAF